MSMKLFEFLVINLAKLFINPIAKFIGWSILSLPCDQQYSITNAKHLQGHDYLTFQLIYLV